MLNSTTDNYEKHCQTLRSKLLNEEKEKEKQQVGKGIFSILSFVKVLKI